MLKYEDKFIVYDFDHGGYNFTRKIVTWLLIIVSSLFLILIIPFLYNCITMPSPLSDGSVRGLGIVIIIILCIYAAIPVCLIRDKRLDKIIAQALADPDLVKYAVEPWVSSTSPGGRYTGELYRMGINFRIDSKKYMKIEKNYSHLYRRFENKEMEILYSPKYDQVLVLDNKERI